MFTGLSQLEALGVMEFYYIVGFVLSCLAICAIFGESKKWGLVTLIIAGTIVLISKELIPFAENFPSAIHESRFKWGTAVSFGGASIVISGAIMILTNKISERRRFRKIMRF